MVNIVKPGLDFVALDVETANSLMSSICQIGYCMVENGQIIRSNSYLVDPDCPFTNSHIHGIGPKTVIGSPKFPEIIATIAADLEGKVIIHHTHFDRNAFASAAVLYGVQLPKSRWMDSAQFMRNVFPRYSERGYGLKALCKDYGVIQTSHHQAEDDAICLAQVFIYALEEAGLELPEITQNRKLRGKANGLDVIKTKGISPKKDVREFVEIEPMVQPATDPVESRSIIFTGDFSVPRAELEQLSTEAGFAVRKGISKAIDYLVVGTPRDVTASHFQPSQKLQKAKEFNAGGANIQLISEEDFYKLIVKAAPAVPVSDASLQDEQDPQIYLSVSDTPPISADDLPTKYVTPAQTIILEQQSDKRRSIFQAFRGLHVIVRILIVSMLIGLLFTCSALFVGFIQAIQETI